MRKLSRQTISFILLIGLFLQNCNPNQSIEQVQRSMEKASVDKEEKQEKILALVEEYDEEEEKEDATLLKHQETYNQSHHTATIPPFTKTSGMMSNPSTRSLEFIKRGSQILNQVTKTDGVTPLLPKPSKKLLTIGRNIQQEDNASNSGGSSSEKDFHPGSGEDDYDEDPELEEAKTRLIKAEQRPAYVKWVYIDHLLEKIAYSIVLKSENVTGVSKKECHGPDFLWVEGRGIPLKDGYSTARAISGFRQGVEFVLKRSLSLTLQGLLIYQIGSQIFQHKTFQPLPILKIMWEGDKQSIQGALAFIVQYPERAPYYLSFFSAPLLWGVIKAVFFARRAVKDTPENFKSAVQVVEDFSLSSKKTCGKSLWEDHVRWLFPLHPVGREINYLVYRLLLDGKLTLEEREEGVEALLDFTRNTHGWSRIAGLEALQKVAAGTAFKQLHRVEEALGKDYKEDIFQEKVQALQEIYNQNPGIRKAGIRGFVHNLYAHYLRWTLGDFDGWKSAVAWSIFKVGMVGVQINLFVKIANHIISYLNCPKPLQQGFTYAMEKANYASSYSSQCLLAYLQNFNKVPGQPAETILSILPRFQNLDPTLFTTLNFTGRGVTGAQVGPLIRGLQQKGLPILTLDLSNNNIGNTTDDMHALLPLPASLTYLDLSENLIGKSDENTGVILGKALPTLPKLRFLKLADLFSSESGKIGTLGDKGTVAIGNGLHTFTNLQYLDLSDNGLGYIKEAEGMIAIGNGLRTLKNLQYLDLSNNGIGSEETKGMIAIGNVLSVLTNLQHLDLSGNSMGYLGDEGVVAIGNGLRALTNLQHLDLSDNYYIGKNDIDGKRLIAIGNGLHALTNLQYLDLSYNWIGQDVDDIEGGKGVIAIGNGLRVLTNLQYLDLSNNGVGEPEKDKGTIAIGNGLHSLTNLQYLDLSSNWIGKQYTEDQGVVVIGNGLRALTNLQHLDLSGNMIGYGGENGVIAIGESFPLLSKLQYLDISRNEIGSPQSANAVNITVDSIMALKFLATLHVQQESSGFFSPFEMTRLRKFWNHRNTQTDIYQLHSLQDVEVYFNDLPNDTTTVSLPGWFNPDDVEVAKTFMEKLASFPLLWYLDLSSNEAMVNLENGAITIVGNGLRSLTNLQYLDLSHNNLGMPDDISVKGLVAIGNSLRVLTNLQYLDLSYNALAGYSTDNGTIAIGNGLRALTNLQYLDLSGNGIGYKGDNGTVAIENGLHFLTKLQHLDLSYNWLGYLGVNEAVAIGNALRSLTNLQALDLSYNGIGTLGDAGTAAITRSLPFLEHLKYFNISYNPLGTEQALQNFSDALSPLLCQGVTVDIQDTGLSTLPWDQASAKLGAYYSSQIQQACEANQCFGTPVTLHNNEICVTSSASSLSPFPIFKLLNFFKRNERPALTYPVLSEEIPMETALVPYQPMQTPSYWDSLQDRFGWRSCHTQAKDAFSSSSANLFLTSAVKGAASTFVLEMMRDGLERKQVSRHASHKALMLTQAGLVIYTTTSLIPTMVGMAVNSGLTSIGVSAPVSAALGSTVAIATSLINGDVVTPIGLAVSLAGGLAGSMLALQVKNKVASWLWGNETERQVSIKIGAFDGGVARH